MTVARRPEAGAVGHGKTRRTCGEPTDDQRSGSALSGCDGHQVSMLLADAGTRSPRGVDQGPIDQAGPPEGHPMQRAIDEHAVIAAEARRISGLIRSADLTATVPHLGRWKVRDIAAHLGGVHRWAARIVSTRSMGGPSFTKSKLTGTELSDWFDAGVEDLLVALRANHADDDCPNFNPGSPNTVAGGRGARCTRPPCIAGTSNPRWDAQRRSTQPSQSRASRTDGPRCDGGG